MDRTPDAWRPANVPLSFRLGEWELLSLAFRGEARRTALDSPPRLRLPEPAREYDGEATFLYYAPYPIAFEPPKVTAAGGWIAYTPETFREHFVDLAGIGSFDAYLARFSSKSRSTLQRKVRRFAQADGGELRLREFRRPEEMDELLALACGVSRKSYQERLLKRGLPASPAFAARLRAAAAAGAVRGYLLFLHDAPVSYVVSFVADGIASYDHVGFDPDCSALSPGTVLQYLVLRSLFAEPAIRVFDFTQGEGAHKAFFATHAVRCARTYFFARRPMLRMLVELHRGLDGFSRGCAGALDRLGVKGRVKRLIRRSA